MWSGGGCEGPEEAFVGGIRPWETGDCRGNLGPTVGKY